ncbi:MAG: amino acid adenylation domain-containing protein, partial [Psychrosphaera sp.]|nr:amino acid adenylation domain-containing protein [Psychrosphaera sp.]
GYNTSVFKQSTIERLISHFKRLLEHIVAEPDLPLHQYVMQFEQEREYLLYTLNKRTEMVVEDDVGIHHLFERQVQQNGQAIALDYHGKTLNYNELNRQANQLAALLRDNGVKTDTLVGVCINRSLDMIVAILAILKAGSAYVPLDPTYPQNRLDYMIQDSGLKLMLTQTQLASKFDNAELKLWCLDDSQLQQQLKSHSDKNVKWPINPQSLAYVIYTSGSTGSPKGVMIEHQQLVASTLSRSGYFKDSVERFLLVSPISFDASVGVIFWTLSTGGILDIADHGTVVGIFALWQRLISGQISHAMLTPALYQAVLDHARQINDIPAYLPEVIILGGEQLSSALVSQHNKRHSHLKSTIYNEYGPTECTVWSTMKRCKTVPNDSSVSIGHGVDHALLYVLGEQGEVLPFGTPGELYIGGSGVGRGYHRLPGLSEQRFIANPFVNDEHARMYKTGDRVRYLPDGSIAFLSRLDAQVKLRGQRIEPGEIEHQLERLPAVNTVVVMVREDMPQQQRLVAYVTLMESEKSSQQALADDWRHELQLILPEYMVPSVFVILDALPMTPSNKVDRLKLPAPEGTGTLDGYVAPNNIIEKSLQRVWIVVLQLDGEAFCVNDNFFALGGHSLLIVKLRHRISAVFGVDVSYNDVFATPTIRGLSRTIMAKRLDLLPTKPLKRLLQSHQLLEHDETKAPLNILLTMNLPYTRCFGGANKSNKCLVEEFAALGHKITVITPALAVPSHITADELLAELRADGLSVEVTLD